MKRAFRRRASRPHSGGRGGLTLVETLITMALGAILLSVLYSILAQVMSIYGRSQARSDLQNEALVALSRLISELRVTTLASLTVCPAPAALCYGVADTRSTFTGSAELFPLFTICWLDTPNHQLMWKRWPAAHDPVVLKPSPFDTGRRLLDTEIGLIASKPNGTERVLARGVDSMQITPSTFPSLGAVDSFSVQLQVSRVWHSEPLSQTVNLSVMPRNEDAILAPPPSGTP